MSNLRNNCRIRLEGLRKTRKTSVRIAGAPVEIGTGHLPNTIHKTLQSEPVWPVYRCCSHVHLVRRENKMGSVGSETAASLDCCLHGRGEGQGDLGSRVN